MALVATVSKVAVDKTGQGRFNVTLRLILVDNGLEVLNLEYIEELLSTENPTSAAGKYIAAMQKDIDNYKSEQAVYNHANMTTLVNTVQTGVVV